MGSFRGVDLQLLSDVRSIAECRLLWQEATGRPPRRFPMPVRVFGRSVGTDLTTMWRRLATAEFFRDAARRVRSFPESLTVRQWLSRR